MKHLFVTVLMLIATTLLLITQARADQISDPQFKQVVRIFEEPSEAVVGRMLYDVYDGQNELTVEALTQFVAIATDQAQVWGDTILEGDYEAEGPTRVDSVEELRLDGVLAGFRVVYSERAWETSTDTEGRIQEASFVSPDLKDWTVDDNAYAAFED